MFVHYLLTRTDNVNIGGETYSVWADRDVSAPVGTTHFEFDDPEKPDDPIHGSTNPLNLYRCDSPMYWQDVPQRYDVEDHMGASLEFASVAEAKETYAASGWKIFRFCNLTTNEEV